MEEYEMTLEEKAVEMVDILESAINFIVTFSDFSKNMEYPFKYNLSENKTRKGYVRVIFKEE